MGTKNQLLRCHLQSYCAGGKGANNICSTVQELAIVKLRLASLLLPGNCTMQPFVLMLPRALLIASAASGSHVGLDLGSDGTTYVEDSPVAVTEIDGNNSEYPAAIQFGSDKVFNINSVYSRRLYNFMQASYVCSLKKLLLLDFRSRSSFV